MKLARVATSVVALRDLNLDIPATDSRKIAKSKQSQTACPRGTGAGSGLHNTCYRCSAMGNPGQALTRGPCRLVVFGLEVGGTVQRRDVGAQAARSRKQRLPCAASGLARAGR